jgi:hypothetical protein
MLSRNHCMIAEEVQLEALSLAASGEPLASGCSSAVENDRFSQLVLEALSLV